MSATINLKRRVKGVNITFDKRESLKLTKLFYIRVLDGRAYVKNKITDTVTKFNENGFFYCSDSRLKKLREVYELIVTDD